MAISVKAETHVMVLHTNRKFVAATPTSVTHTQTDNKNLNVLIILSINIDGTMLVGMARCPNEMRPG